VAININIDSAVIKRLAENLLQEKIAVFYDVYQCIVVEAFSVDIMLGGSGITETYLKFAERKPMVTMAGQDLKSVACAPMCLQWKPMWYSLLCVASGYGNLS